MLDVLTSPFECQKVGAFLPPVPLSLIRPLYPGKGVDGCIS
jgi:hypothetical protein